MTYYLPKSISSQDKRFIDAFFSSFSAFRSPLSRSKAYNMTESSCIQIAIVSSVRINIWQCTRKHHGTRRYHGIIWNSLNVRKSSACANSGYQALFRMGLGTRLWFIMYVVWDKNYLSVKLDCMNDQEFVIVIYRWKSCCLLGFE